MCRKFLDIVIACSLALAPFAIHAEEPSHQPLPESKAEKVTPETVESWVTVGKAYYHGDKQFDQDYETAFDYFAKAANHNHPEALYYLGNQYFQGEGVDRDEKRGEAYYRKAAELGQTDSQMIVGVLHIFEGVTKKPDSPEQKEVYENAVRWLKPAAEKGHAEAQFWYGDMLMKGAGVPANEKLGIQFLRKSAEQNNANGQAMLGANYWFGKGVKKNLVEGYKWILLSERGKNENAFKIGRQMRREMTPEQIKEATALAVAWEKEHPRKAEERNFFFFKRR